LPVGRSEEGVLIPPSAVVWKDGKAWVYVERGEGSFVRKQVSADAQAVGSFVVSNLPAGTRVVVRGAQLLLSEEFHTEVHAGEEEGDK
jgi:hypothetical protein